VSDREWVGGDMPLTLAAALLYAGMGWPVFPTRGKQPRTLHGFKDATTDANRLRQWWGMWPDAGVAVATGKVSGLVVLDLDGDEGEQTGEERGVWTAEPPATLTGSGAHLFYRWPHHVANRTRVLPGVDVRGDGGYACLPPSDHPNGRRYGWLRAPEGLPPTAPSVDGMPGPADPYRPLRELPAWVLQRRDNPGTMAAPHRRISPGYAHAAFEAELSTVATSAVGTRNDALNRSAFAVARFVRAGDIPAVEYRARFLQAAATAGLPEQEADRTLRSALEGRSRG
jgi:Bifunctional DNA primase/polymerase, N-terminal